MELTRNVKIDDVKDWKDIIANNHININKEFNDLLEEDYDKDLDKLVYKPSADCRRFAMSLFIDMKNKMNFKHTLRTILNKIGMLEVDLLYKNKETTLRPDNNTKDKHYIFQSIDANDETETQNANRKRDINESKASKLYDWAVLDTEDNEDNNKYRQFLLGNGTNKDIGRLKMLGIDKQFVKDILVKNKNIDKLYNELEFKPYTITLRDFDALLENKEHNVWKSYDNMRYFIKNNTDIENKLNELRTTDNKINILHHPLNKVKIYKYLMKTYAVNVNWYDFSYSTGDPYIQNEVKIINEDYILYEGLGIKTKKKARFAIKTRKDFLKNIAMPILTDLFSSSNIKSKKNVIKVNNKTDTYINYAGITDYVNNVVKMYFVGNNFNKDIDIWVSRLDEDIKTAFLTNINKYKVAISEYKKSLTIDEIDEENDENDENTVFNAIKYKPRVINVVDYENMINEIKELFNDDINIKLRRECDPTSYSTYEYETKKKIRVVLTNINNKHLNFEDNYTGSLELKNIIKKYYCSISWYGCDNKTAILFNYLPD
jgi:hypothetical protein